MDTPSAHDLDLVIALAAEERKGVRHHVAIGPFTAFCVIGALQLAWRHPDLSDGATSTAIRGLGEQLTTLFDPTTQALLVKGWDRRYDAPLGGDHVPTD